FLYYCHRPHRDLHSFPTRRSSDLKRAEALRDGVRLHVAVVVLARPHISAWPLQRSRDHVVDQPVFIRDRRLLEVMLELGLENLRSEEHTSELQSLAYLVCRLLLEK